VTWPRAAASSANQSVTRPRTREENYRVQEEDAYRDFRDEPRPKETRARLHADVRRVFNASRGNESLSRAIGETGARRRVLSVRDNEKISCAVHPADVARHGTARATPLALAAEAIANFVTPLFVPRANVNSHLGRANSPSSVRHFTRRIRGPLLFAACGTMTRRRRSSDYVARYRRDTRSCLGKRSSDKFATICLTR